MERMLREIFREHGGDEKGLVEAVESLVRERGSDVYREVFRYLFRKDMDTLRARRYWREAIARWEALAKEKSGLQKIRGALLDYLYHVAGERLSSVSNGLTGLYNQAYLKTYLENILAYQRRKDRNKPLSLILLDLDRKGFPSEMRFCATGDRILRRTADLIRIHIRNMDVPAFLDTGEFAILLPGTSLLQAHKVAERLRSAAGQLISDDEPDRLAVPLTFSCGVVSCPDSGETAHALLREGFKELSAASLKGDTVSPESAERRREDRARVHSLVELQVEEGEIYASAMTFDISRHGIGFGCDLDLSEGASLKVRFRRPYWSTSKEVSGRVRRSSREVRSGISRIGLEFEQEEADLFNALHVEYPLVGESPSVQAFSI